MDTDTGELCDRDDGCPDTAIPDTAGSHNMVSCEAGTVFMVARNSGTADTIRKLDPVTGTLDAGWVLAGHDEPHGVYERRSCSNSTRSRVR